MKNIKKTGLRICASLIILLTSSCSDVLDVKDYSVINPEIWNSEQSATLYINNLYNYLDATSCDLLGGGTNWGRNASMTEEVTQGTIYTDGSAERGSVAYWDATTYAQIREINIGIEELQGSTLANAVRKRLEAECRFIRAWKYWNLVLLYGGVPIVTEAVNPFTDSSTKLDPVRNKTSECIEFICNDLDSAAKYLPSAVVANERLRAVRSAAASLKGRVLLFYASPQFNPSDDRSRWQAAYTANKTARELCESDGHALYSDFEKLFLVSQNSEAIMISKCYSSSLSITHSWDNSVRPNIGGIGTGGTTCNPTWNMVKAFPMKNGKYTDDPSSAYDETHYWMNRDERFYKTIAYNGASWPITGMTYTQSNETKSIATIWTYTSSNTMPSGKATTTGFYCRKGTDKSIDKTLADKCTSDWVEIRFAEVLLNLAEAAFEVGQDEEAYSALKLIRARAGIEAGSDGYYGLKTSFLTPIELVMRERQVELAYENKRFWDLRRRHLYTTALSENTPKLNGTQRLRLRFTAKSPYTATILNTWNRDTINVDANHTKYFNFTTISEATTNILNVPEKYDFFDIPNDILARSSYLLPTKGWNTDSEEAFDPWQ
jgi:hypothetical protein